MPPAESAYLNAPPRSLAAVRSDLRELLRGLIERQDRLLQRRVSEPENEEMLCLRLARLWQERRAIERRLQIIEENMR